MSIIRLFPLLVLVGSSWAALPPMLRLPAAGEDPGRIDYRGLPVLPGEHRLVTKGPHEIRGMEAVEQLHRGELR